MNNKIKNNILECGICFESLDSKQIDLSTQLYCSHVYHDKCLKKWCIQCIEQSYEPNCPLCRKVIDGEYLEILGVYQDKLSQTETIFNTLKLFDYIIKNKIYQNLDNLDRIMQKYPDEFENISNMLKGYFLLNSLRNNFEQT